MNIYAHKHKPDGVIYVGKSKRSFKIAHKSTTFFWYAQIFPQKKTVRK